MKMRILYVMILALALLALSACQPSAAPAANNTPAAGSQNPGSQAENPYPAAEITTEPPAELSTYPGIADPAAVAEAVDDGAYPDIADGSSIEWSKAKGLITRGEVVKVISGANEQVTLNLKDGRTLTAVMEDPQSLQTALDACEVCAELEVVTE